MTSTAPFTTTWTSGSDSFDRLYIGVPGLTFVKYNASLVDAATVVLTSSSREILDAIVTEVVGTGRNIFEGAGHITYISTASELKVHFAEDIELDAYGTLLVEVTLNAPINAITSIADTVIEEGALPLGSDANIDVTSVGHNNIWIDSTDASVAKLSLTVSGAGNTYLKASTLHVADVARFNIMGAGSVVIEAAEVSANAIESNVFGRGSVAVHGNTVANSLQTNLMGSGIVSYYPSGTCQTSSVQIGGQGDAYLASVACDATSVNIMGHGDAYVQTRMGSGSIKYFNTTPAHLPEEHIHSFFRQPKVELTTDNKFKSAVIATEPTVNDAKSIDLHLTVGTFSWLHTPPPETLASAQATSDGFFDASYGLAVVAMLIVSLIAFVAFKKAKKRVTYEALP
ncbi:hypothetical protein AC1031_013026 [Aphanomyces cochlioides]|nr:hypothetical protein AC1031_013026 [Aphanomyces cochlioides]